MKTALIINICLLFMGVGHIPKQEITLDEFKCKISQVEYKEKMLKQEERELVKLKKKHSRLVQKNVELAVKLQIQN